MTNFVTLVGARPYFLDAAEHDGLMAGVEFVRNKQTKEPFPVEYLFGKRVFEEAFARYAHAETAISVNSATAALHLARTVCRRAERRMVALAVLEVEFLAYMNRLSDLLFVMARVANRRAGEIESEW